MFNESNTPENALPKDNKLLLFKVMAILSPLAFWLVIELILRLFDYGNNTNLFVKYPPEPGYWVMNYNASDRFFPDTLSATKGNQEIFAINKAPNTIRIFVLGESTTLGFPFRPNGSFHRWLQYRLMHTYPDKNFEVINLSLTAVNSFTVLDFGKQLKEYQPDAVLIYTGHNEYYGALGVGSTTYVSSNRFLLHLLVNLRELKSVQLFNNMIRSIACCFTNNATSDPKSLMETMAARQHIVYNSPDYKAGIKQFDENMTELCHILNDEKIPTFLSTVVSNEKDQPPFISEGNGTGSANFYYNAGQLAWKKLSYDMAKLYFDKAKELDQLRFRAPEAINSDIRKIVNKFPNVHLVDTKLLFEQYSPHGVVGNETITEHVHPNLLGYAIMSEAFYREIQKQNIVKSAPEKEMSFEQLRKEMPITRLDSAMGLYQVIMLKTQWPFNQPISKQFKVGKSIDEVMAVKVALGHTIWTTAMGEVFRYDENKKDSLGALKIAEAMVLQYPYSQGFYEYAIKLNSALKDYSEAAFYCRKLYMINHDPHLMEAAFKLYLKADEPQLALKLVKYSSRQPEEVTQLLTSIINDETLLKKESKNIHAKRRIAENYDKLSPDIVPEIPFGHPNRHQF